MKWRGRRTGRSRRCGRGWSTLEHVFQVMKLKFGFVKVRYPRAAEDRAPAVRYLCAGESVCEPQKTTRRSVGSSGFAPYARLQWQY
jgi:hypothetical protein